MFVFQSLTLVKDKTLAIFQQCLLLFKRSPFWKTSRLPFVPVSILSKLWPSWKTTRLPFVCTRVHSLQILTVLKKETLVVFQISANFFNISPCWRTIRLPFFVEPVYILFKIAPSWKNKKRNARHVLIQCLFLQSLNVLKDKTPAICYQCLFFNISPWWKIKRLPFSAASTFV